MEDNEDEAKAEPEFTYVPTRQKFDRLEGLAPTPRVDTERAFDLCRLAITQLRDIKSPKLALGTLADLLEELS